MTQTDTWGRPSGVQWNTGEIHTHCAVILMPGLNLKHVPHGA